MFLSSNYSTLKYLLHGSFVIVFLETWFIDLMMNKLLRVFWSEKERTTALLYLCRVSGEVHATHCPNIAGLLGVFTMQ